jgi:protocatechuate 3,4-dioxygenase beta subunit
MAALAFLTEVGRADEFVLLSDVTRTSVLIDALSHGSDESGATASDVEGPMYRDDPPWREKPARIYERYDGMGDGDVLFVRGTVTSTGGEPVADAVVDVWQTGPNGYDFWDPRQPENNFRGRIRTEPSGAYEFETMVPTPYTVPTEGPVGRYLEAVGQHPWRPAHIHFKVSAPGHHTLVTQVFFPDDPYLENDTIGAVKPALVRPLTREDDHLACQFDVSLRPA